jgi:hypothetical protein
MPDLAATTELVIANEHLHHHATSVLNEHASLHDMLNHCIRGTRDVACVERRARQRRYLGVAADSLNASLKATFAATNQWTFEATIEDGVIFDSAEVDARVGGFDIARYDERANLARLWSACFGRRPRRDGRELWDRYVTRRPSLTETAEEVAAAGRDGEDLVFDPRSPTILGEVQFGNWGLAYRDVMKLLAATTELEVDLFVYVAADGQLASMISSGTVNFSNFARILQDFASVITVPTWLVGIDFAPGLAPTLEGITAPAVAAEPDPRSTYG